MPKSLVSKIQLFLRNSLPLTAVILASCGSLQTHRDLKSNRVRLEPKPKLTGEREVASVKVEETPVVESELIAEPQSLVAENDQEVESKGIPEPKVEKSLRIPVEINSRVEKWIEYFTVKDRERFQRFLDRGQHYREIVQNVLEENDLPSELYYLAMIESGYQTSARSVASAVGVWQFIKGTGERYGLMINSEVDERKDPIRATEAAAKYLRDLHNVFGSWHLALAAYNAGEYRVLQAVFRGRSRNFWDLVDANVLPRETAEYVPKFLAVVLIGKEPEKYGFKINEVESPYPNLRAVEVPGNLKLDQITSVAGIPAGVLKKFNPHLIKGRTPSRGSYEIWVPMQYADAVTKSNQRLVAIAAKSRVVAKNSASEAKSQNFHTVRAGENLARIAKKYKVTVGHLKRANNLRSDRIYVGQRLRIQSPVYYASKRAYYKVRRGDNLTIIARKFGTSVSELRRKNNLKRNKIYVGQVLRVR